MHKPTLALRLKLMSSVAILSAVAASFSPNAVAVYPPASEITQIMNQFQLLAQKVQAGAEYGSTQAHRLEEIRDMQRKLTSLSKMMNLLNMPVSFDLAKRDEREGVAERCPGTEPGFSLRSVIDRIKPTGDKDTIKQQLAICQSIVILENRKHNELVKMFTYASEKMKKISNELDKELKSSSDPGVAVAGQSSAQVMLNQSVVEAEYSASKVEGYDHLIASLKNDQAALARRALKGGNNPVGTVFKTLALATALEVNESE